MDLDRIIQGDALTELRKLPGESVDCCVTSPPYWSLRNYNVDGQIGLEDSPDEYVLKLVEVFREVKRVLKAAGTLWLNLGDCYAGSWGNYSPKSSCPKEGWTETRFDRRAYDDRTWRPPNSHRQDGLKTKDLIGLPWMVAFALRADGWWLRSDIIWHKPNPMPESIKDRPTKTHEYIFLLSKSEVYFYDSEAIKEDAVSTKPSGNGFNGRQGGSSRVGPQSGGEGSPEKWQPSGKRNRRSVWTIATHPYKEAHFATFPEKLVEPCILAGTSEKGYCPACGNPWIRQIEKTFIPQQDVSTEKGVRGAQQQKPMDESNSWQGFPRGTTKTITSGWAPSCECSCDPVPGVVIDPFVGAGTVSLVAKKLGRHYIGIELNPDYIKMAERRIATVPARRDQWGEVKA